MEDKEGMQEIINLDGIKIRLKAPDLDNDGITGEVETITRQFDPGITSVQQNTELEGALKELNEDEINIGARNSGIDMRARLHPMEISSVLALDALVALRVLHTRNLAFSRQKKRLSVSIKGEGRKEIVDVVSGKKEQDAKMGGLGERIKTGIGGFFGGQK